MTEIDDITLRQAIRGRPAAFRRVYEYYAPFLWKVIYRTVGGDQDCAREILQTSFIRIWKSLKSFSRGSAFSTWTYRIAYNACQSFLARRKKEWDRSAEYLDNIPGESNQDSGDLAREVEDLLGRLSPQERFVLTAHEVGGMAFDEIAQITGKSAGALRVQVHRMKERIRKEVVHEPARV
jgi:RNA polymerase sigma-70 factor (ECF subfamily)